MSKSSQAFRTIREVAEWLGVATHVLRFWESKFAQIKPVKRAGGRRYYRPADMELIGGIKVLLHDRGMTIRGVQRLIRENGVAAVAALSPDLDLHSPSHDEADWADDTADAPILRAEAPAPASAARDAEPAMPAAADPAPAPQPALPLPQPIAPPKARGFAPAPPAARISQNLARLAGLVADPARLPPRARETLRPALVALRDRMRA